MKNLLKHLWILKIGLVLLCVQAFSQKSNQLTNDKYFRHIAYNHVSPHVPIKGIHEIKSKEAEETSHYKFKFNKANQIVEIINNHYHSQRPHPLATFDAYRISFEYTPTSETRIFFDKAGNRITNGRGVYREVYQYNKKGFKSKLSFYDLKNKPMESNWNIANYQWNRHKKLVIEKRFNLKNEAENISPYFEFGITGILYRKDGLPKTNYNLNDKLEVIENSVGVASYQDVYDQEGNHIQFSYHNKSDGLTKNQWGYAVGKKIHDKNGNQIIDTILDENMVVINTHKAPSNIDTQLAEPVTKKDSLAIKNRSLGYLIALQELKPDLMEKVFHPELAKRTIGYNQKARREIIRETTYEQMVEFAKSWNKSGTKFPPKPTNEVYILDIYNRAASVKLVSDNWIEYLHLVKTNDEWNIINLFWLYKDARRYVTK